MKHARADYDRIQDPAGKIPDDEPVFLLRGQDPAAWAAVDFWVRAARNCGASPDILRLAEDQALKMQKWAFEHGKHHPDLPTPQETQ